MAQPAFDTGLERRIDEEGSSSLPDLKALFADFEELKVLYCDQSSSNEFAYPLNVDTIRGFIREGVAMLDGRTDHSDRVMESFYSRLKGPIEEFIDNVTEDIVDQKGLNNLRSRLYHKVASALGRGREHWRTKERLTDMVKDVSDLICARIRKQFFIPQQVLAFPASGESSNFPPDFFQNVDRGALGVFTLSLRNLVESSSLSALQEFLCDLFQSPHRYPLLYKRLGEDPAFLARIHDWHRRIEHITFLYAVAVERLEELKRSGLRPPEESGEGVIEDEGENGSGNGIDASAQNQNVPTAPTVPEPVEDVQAVVIAATEQVSAAVERAPAVPLPALRRLVFTYILGSWTDAKRLGVMQQEFPDVEWNVERIVVPAELIASVRGVLMSSVSDKFGAIGRILENYRADVGSSVVVAQMVKAEAGNEKPEVRIEFELVAGEEPESGTEIELVAGEEPESGTEIELISGEEPEVGVEFEVVAGEEPESGTEFELISGEEPESGTEIELFVGDDEPKEKVKEEAQTVLRPAIAQKVSQPTSKPRAKRELREDQPRLLSSEELAARLLEARTHRLLPGVQEELAEPPVPKKLSRAALRMAEQATARMQKEIPVFEIGQTVNHDTQGQGKIEEIVVRAGEKYYRVRLAHGHGKCFVPFDRPHVLRKGISPEVLEEVMDVLRETGYAVDQEQTWNRRYRVYKDLMSSGSLHDIAATFRDMERLKTEGRPLSFGERRMHDGSLERLCSEVSTVTGRPIEEVEKMLKAKIAVAQDS